MYRPFSMKRLLLLALIPAAHASDVTFTKQVVSEEFVSEGAAVADFDGDGHKDIAAGPYLWLGPKFEQRVTYTAPPAAPYDGAKGYSDYFLADSTDLNGDGRADIVVFDYPGKQTWGFVNPGKPGELWNRYALLNSTDGESPALGDVTGDGRPEILCLSAGSPGYAEIPWGPSPGPARFQAVAPADPKRYQRYTHGYGAGDLNGDKRTDLLEKDGWYEQPAEAGKAWTFHPEKFSPPAQRGGAQMLVFDVNGDGRNDVVTSYNAHEYGLGWFEQTADGHFTEHRILATEAVKTQGAVSFSQLHALAAADINGDGVTDFVTGKRHWAHGPNNDPEPNSDSVLYWFETRRDGKGGAEIIPHEIDRNSGVGTQVTATDVDGNGRPDVVVSNKNGVFVFLQKAL